MVKIWRQLGDWGWRNGACDGLFANAAGAELAGALEGSRLRAELDRIADDAHSERCLREACEVVDALLGALHQATPERVCAACSGEMNLLNIGGLDPQTGVYYNYVETYAGGQGAMHDLDGEDGVHTHLTNTRNAPVEVIERTYPLQVVQYGLVPDTSGAGKHRGGSGMMRELRCLGERTIVTIGADRRKFTPWGLEGGQHAKGAHCYVTEPDGNVRELPTKVFTILSKGETLMIQTPGGGGWGPPGERDTDRIEKDLENGLISSDNTNVTYHNNKD